MTLEERSVQDNPIIVDVITAIIVNAIIVTVIINVLGYSWPL